MLLLPLLQSLELLLQLSQVMLIRLLNHEILIGIALQLRKILPPDFPQSSLHLQHILMALLFLLLLFSLFLSNFPQFFFEESSLSPILFRIRFLTQHLSLVATDGLNDFYFFECMIDACVHLSYAPLQSQLGLTGLHLALPQFSNSLLASVNLLVSYLQFPPQTYRLRTPLRVPFPFRQSLLLQFAAQFLTYCNQFLSQFVVLSIQLVQSQLAGFGIRYLLSFPPFIERRTPSGFMEE